MTETTFKLPRKFTFDEYYEILKEYLADPEVYKQWAIADAESEAGRCSWGMGDSWVYMDAINAARWIGAKILHRYGWPSLVGASAEDMEEASRLRYTQTVDSLESDAKMVVRGEWPEIWPDLKYNLQDKASIRVLLKLNSEIELFATTCLYDLRDN